MGILDARRRYAQPGRTPEPSSLALQEMIRPSSSDLAGTTRGACVTLAEALGDVSVTIHLYDPAAHALVILGDSESKAYAGAPMTNVTLPRAGVLAEVFTTGQPHRTSDVLGAWDPGKRLLRRPGERALLVVRLRNDMKPLGVIRVASLRPRAFSDEETRFLESASLWVSMALRRAGLFERVTNLTRHMLHLSSSAALALFKDDRDPASDARISF